MLTKKFVLSPVTVRKNKGNSKAFFTSNAKYVWYFKLDGLSLHTSYTYSVDSIKHTVLLKVLFQIFVLVSIKSTVYWKFSR